MVTEGGGGGGGIIIFCMPKLLDHRPYVLGRTEQEGRIFKISRYI